MQENGPHDGHALPLKGIILCSTSISQDVRTSLVELSNNMGAIHRLDLTTDVTHLIVGQVDTPKYKHVAKERPDIHVLHPKWIDAMRLAWTSAEDFDVSAIMEEYRLPALFGLQICVTGFDDLDQRQALMQSIKDNGATYNGDLTRAVTHLVARRPEGLKYERAKQWGLNVVSIRWLQQSLERGMVLEASLYDPLLSEDRQGQGAFIRDYQTTSAIRKRNIDTTRAQMPEENSKRKLRRTVSSRLNSHSQTMWAEISTVEDAAPIKNESHWNEPGQVVDETTLAIPEDAPTQRTSFTVSGEVVGQPGTNSAEHPEPRNGLFSSCLFQVMGHPPKRSQKILEILQNEGGQIADYPDDLYSAVESQNHQLTALIVPSEWHKESEEALPDVPEDTWLVTEWWIERCIVSKSIIDPQQDFYSRPRMALPMECFKDLIISTSGLGNDAKLMQNIVRSAGGEYDEHLKPTCSVLVIRSAASNKAKITYAMKHNVPVVFENWFQTCVTQGQRLPFTLFRVPHPDKADRVVRGQNASRQSEVQRRKDDSHVQRLSATRKKSSVPSLKLIKTTTMQPPREPQMVLKLETSKSTTVPLPFTEEDASPVDDNPAPFLELAHSHGTESQPLRELPPNASNSPLKKSEAKNSTKNTIPLADSHGEDHLTPTHTYTDYGHTSEDLPNLALDEYMDLPIGERVTEVHTTTAPATDDDKLRLTEEIKSLLERRKEASASAEQALPPRKRKDRKLGRAPSNMSNPPAPASLRYGRSTEVEESTASASPMDLGMIIPSQQLGYETADAKEHRARMSKRTGTNLLDNESTGKRVESIGLVKDIAADNGGTSVGGRVRRSRHAKS
ncbi:hypothetical protein AAFC00_002717 [Neodothiora populina]|uniref:BRCT domain-containing protein n=1 Tax=Neodothiora populina TaxID=2781224 RepID=A0ABR3P8A7_9PEZI